MSRFGERNDPIGGCRKIARQSISTPGSVLSIDGSRSIVVEDVSRHGARICGHHLPATGRRVLVRTDGLDVLGCVVWARFRQRGIAFDTDAEKPAG